MKIYRTKCSELTGTSYREVNKKAQAIYREIKKKTKRKPYVRSEYFNKEKVFLDLFWQHLWQKENFRDKIRRIKLFSCAVELIQKTKYDPQIIKKLTKKKEVYYKFAGMTNKDDLFHVQVKEELKTGNKYFMSVFPE